MNRQLKGIKADVKAMVRPELDKAAAIRAVDDMRALSARLAKARDAEADAAGKVRIAEQRLTEARESGKAKASQLAAAEERLAATHRMLAAAQRVTVRVSEQVDAAHRRAAESAAVANRNTRGFVASLQGITAGFRQIDDTPLKNAAGNLIKIGAYGAAAAAGLVALGSSVPALITLAGALAAVAGAAGLIPAAIGAGALAIGALVVGLVGIADAFKPAEQAIGAVNSLAAAQRAADRAAIQSAEQVRAARQAVVDAQVNGARRVHDAEAALTRAQQSARDAQEALTRARKDAAEQLEDLRLALSGAGLDERAAELGLRRARQRLAEAQAGGATGLDLEEAILGVDQAAQSLAEVRERYADLQAEAQAANRAGVDGARNVVDAQRQVLDATQAVRDAEGDLAQARADSARDTADAQRNLAQAQQQAAWAQADAATALAQAQQTLARTAPAELAASAAAFVAAVKAFGPAWTALRLDVQERLFAGIAGHVTALGNRYLPILRTALGGVADSLNRGVRSVAEFFETPAATADVTTALGDMRTGIDLASGAMRPLTQAWTDFLVVGASFLPGIGVGVTDLSTRFAEFVRTARETGQLRDWIQGGIDRLTQLKDIAVNLASILGSLFSAAQAAGSDFLITVRDLTGELAAALRSPEGQATLQGFFVSLRQLVESLKPGLRDIGGAISSVITELGPVLPQVGDAFSAVAKALRPVVEEGARLVRLVLPPMVTALKFIAPALGPIVVGLLAAYAAFKTWLILSTIIGFVRAFIAGQLVLNAVLRANTIGIIIAALAGLVALLVYAYRNNETFRAVVQRVWADVQKVVAFAWNTIIKPIFEALSWYVTTVIGPAMLWLWRNVVEPAFTGIGIIVSWAWDTIIKPAFTALDWYMRTIVGPTLLWLWRTIVQPAFEGIGTIISTVWNAVVRPTFDALKNAVAQVADSFRAAVNNIGNAWDKIQELALRPVNFVIGTIYNDGIRAAFNKVAETLGAGFRLPFLPLLTLPSVGGARGLAPMASGGPVPGTGTGDKVMILADPREYVLNPKMVDAFGVRNLEAMRRETLRGRAVSAEGMLAGFAEGGPIERATAFARSQAGKPYQWAGVGNPSYDCCLTGESRVYGPDGARPIRDVRAGERVYSYVDGRLEPRTVTAAWQSQRQPVFAVRTRNRTVIASANHPFMRLRKTTDRVIRYDRADWPGLPAAPAPRGARAEQVCSVSTCLRPARSRGLCSTCYSRWRQHGDPRARTTTAHGYQVEWARLDQLQRGDLLVQPRLLPVDHKPQPHLPDGTPVDADVAWLLGALIGDGTVTSSDVRLCMYGAHRDRAAQIVREHWGKESTYSRDYGMRVLASSALARTLTTLGLRRPGPDKRVPDVVWTWEPALRRAFLDGYCDADGHRPADAARHGERSYHSASRELVADVRALHMTLGDPVSNITTTERRRPITIKGKPVRSARDLHSFIVWRASGRGEAGLRQRPELARWLDAGEFTVAAVLGVRPQGERETWDIEVEGAHNFVADGVVVHNSGFMSAIQNVLLGRPPNRRLYTTSQFGPGHAPAGLKPGLGSAFTVGVQRGHMAGTLNGVAVESGGSGGVMFGGRARGTRSFPWQFYLPAAGGQFVDDGGGGDSGFVINQLRKIIDGVFARVTPHVGGGEFGALMARIPRKTADLALQRLANVVDRHLPFDQGGLLPPGWSTVYNGTGKPEAVFTAQQMDAFAQRGTGDKHFHLQAITTPTADVVTQFRRMEMQAGV